MPREGAIEKGRRYVSEGRLTVTAVEGDYIAAECRGGGEVYRLIHTPRAGWRCDCPARTRCAHVVALQLVTIRNRRETPA